MGEEKYDKDERLDQNERATARGESEAMLDTIRMIETELQNAYRLKLLTHRTHRQFISNDVHYRTIQFDSNGRIDYKTIWM